MPVAIQVEGLSKRYRIGELQAAYGTLRESLSRTSKRLTGKEQRSGYEEIWALKDVSFSLEEGHALGVIGRNGAGKSTLLKVLTRITTPTHGRAEIRGRVGSLLEVGTGFHPELTGRENVYLNGAILGMRRKEIQAKLPEIAEFSGRRSSSTRRSSVTRAACTCASRSRWPRTSSRRSCSWTRC